MKTNSSLLSKQIKSFVQLSNAIAILCFILTIFHLISDEILAIICFILPITAIVWIWKGAGKVKIEWELNDQNCISIMPSIGFPVLSILLISIQNIELLNYFDIKLLLFGLLFSVLPVIFLFKFSNEYNKRDGGSKLLAIVSVFVFWLHGISAVMYINYRLDYTNSDVYFIKIIDKGASSGKSGTSYWIKAAKNGPIENERIFNINRATYSNIQEGDLMELELHQGLLGIAWLKLRQ